MLLDRFARAAATWPQRLAVVAGTSRLSYEELDIASTRLAARITGRGLVDGGALIAIYLERSAELVAALVGTLKSGNAYTIVDTAESPQQCAHRLLDIAPALIVTTGVKIGELTSLGMAILDISDESADLRVGPRAPVNVERDDTAYVLFTSGSTGRPKGVAVTHGNIDHYVQALLTRLAIPDGLRYAHVSTLAADLGNTSLFLSMATGGTLHLLLEKTRRSASLFVDYLIVERIQFLKIAPSHWQLMFNPLRVGPSVAGGYMLDYLVLGGEVLSRSLAASVLRSGLVRHVVNHYGPTETTVGVLTYAITETDLPHAGTSLSIPIGTPLGDTRVLVQDSAGAFHERSATGELYIGGPSVAAGYRNNPVETALKFVRGVAQNRDMRFYRSGDLVHIDDSGVVTFVARVDRQVKIDGHRVELEEVEMALLQIDGIREAHACVIQARGRSRLGAAVALEDAAGADYQGVPRTRAQEGPLHLQLRDDLGRRFTQGLAKILPRHMIPQHYAVASVFPLNSNGKVDSLEIATALVRAVETGYADFDATLAIHDDGLREDPIALDVLQVWHALLRRTDFSVDDDFFLLGGDSIDAICVISELQQKGYGVSAIDVSGQMTIRSLVDAIGRATDQESTHAMHIPLNESDILGPSQQWFFEQHFSQPDHWNQAFLLEASVPIDPTLLTSILSELVATHPLLRTGIDGDANDRRARLREWSIGNLFSMSACATDEDDAVSSHIQEVALRLHHAIDVRRGRVFKVHLFKVPGKPDRILLICHHLSVDAVSWRILISDIARLYNSHIEETTLHLPPARVSYWDWVQHLRQHEGRIAESAAYWRDIQARSRQRHREKPEGNGKARNREADSVSVWLMFSRAETEALTSGLALYGGGPFHGILLGAFLHHYCRWRRCATLLVEVESHGRIVFDRTLDVSRTVGWLTSAFPLWFELTSDDLKTSITDMNRLLRTVPDFGIGYPAVRDEHIPQKEHSDRSPRDAVPELLYNYLGDLSFRSWGPCVLAPCSGPIGPARGDENARVHALKLSARILRDQLVVDLSFSRQRNAAAPLKTLLEAVATDLLEFAGRQGAIKTGLVLHGSTTGLLGYVPPQLDFDKQTLTTTSNHLRRIVLTGASGFIGVHFLRALLADTDWEITCLVRRADGDSPADRLRSEYRRHFPDDSSYLDQRCRVVTGDISVPRFGLAEEEFLGLAASCDAIYHFAGDTRLFAPSNAMERTNVLSVETMLQFAACRRPMACHYLSTLAVCGVNRLGSQAQFSETSLDLGQSFLNEYEHSKHAAEVMLGAYIRQGGLASIYRVGNVSGHSETGAFRSDPSNNRLVQFLVGVARLGILPAASNETIALTPVDDVARAILVLSESPHSLGGTFHVDNGIDLKLLDIFSVLQEYGVTFERSSHGSFAALLNDTHILDDKSVALARFWANREPRNVAYDHSRTMGLLARRGFVFHPVGRTWLRRFVALLVDAGLFRPAADP